MTIKNILVDGTGTKRQTKIDNTNALFVQPMSHPPFIPQKVFPFTQFFTIDGTSTGSTDMRVVGTLVNPIDFFIKADNVDDLYITTLSFVIADVNASLNQFGNIAILSNGVELLYTNFNGDISIRSSLRTNFDFVQLACGQPAFGSGANAFKANNVFNNIEAYIPCIDLTKMGLPFGIKLDAGTQQKMILRIKDNTSGVDAFTCCSMGFKRRP